MSLPETLRKHLRTLVVLDTRLSCGYWEIDAENCGLDSYVMSPVSSRQSISFYLTRLAILASSPRSNCRQGSTGMDTDDGGESPGESGAFSNGNLEIYPTIR